MSAFQTLHGDRNYVLPCCFLHTFHSVRVNVQHFILARYYHAKRSLGLKSDSLRCKKPFCMCYRHSVCATVILYVLPSFCMCYHHSVCVIIILYVLSSFCMCYHHSHLYCWNCFFILALLHDCGLFLRQAGLWEQLWLLLRMYLELNLAQPDSSHFKLSSALSEQTVSKHLHSCTHLFWYHTGNVLSLFIPQYEG